MTQANLRQLLPYLLPWGALAFWIGLWAGRRLWGKSPPLDNIQPGGLRCFLEVIGFGACIRLMGADSLGPYGIGLFLGFFGPVLFSFVEVAASKVRDEDSLLDGRQLRPMRSVTAGIAPLGAEDVAATMPLWVRPGDTVKLWVELGPPVTRPDEVPSVTSGNPSSRLRFKVALFTFANELHVERGADVKEFDLDTVESGSARYDPSAASPGRSTSPRPSKRIDFLVRAPKRAGRHRIRCNIYFNDALVQSRLFYVRVRKLPHLVERSLRSVADPVRDLTHQPRVAPSNVDFSLTRALDPHQLAQLRPPRLSLILNDNDDGTHSLRLHGPEFKANATFDGMELQDHIDRVRGALRRVAWGNEDPWKEGIDYRYAHWDVAKLETDLAVLAVSGFRFYTAVIKRFESDDATQSEARTGSEDCADRLKNLMREPGRVELALKHSASLVLPAAMFYDYRLDTNAPTLRLCDSFRENLSSREVSLGETPCFRGACPNRDKLNVVCPGGFWGFRHSLGMPLSVAKGTSQPLVIPCPGAPQLAVAVSTDPQFTMRSKHVEALKRLLTKENWEYGDTRDTVLRLLKETHAHVIYFYCHGGVSGERNKTPFILVGSPSETGITADNLDGFSVHWRDPRPLVFINGCHTAEVEPKTGINFVSSFVQTAKAAGVIGTEITVFEPLATAFAEHCLLRFLKFRDEVGEAVRDARLTLLKAGNPLGLAYIPYAVPSLQLAPEPTN